MKKQDVLIIVALFGLWLAWPHIDKNLIRPMTGAAPAPAEQAADAPPEAEKAVAPADAIERPEAVQTELFEEEAPAEPGRIVTLSNKQLTVSFSTRGAALMRAVLHGYRETEAPDSPPVELDFAGSPALAYADWPGLGARAAFQVEQDADRLIFSRTTGQGLGFRRTVTLDDDYVVRVEDAFENEGEAPLVLPDAGLTLGGLRMLPGEKPEKGVTALGVDTLSQGGKKPRYWAKFFDDWFKDAQEAAGGKMPVDVTVRLDELPDEDDRVYGVDWAAAKTRYFVEILAPESGAERCRLTVARQPEGDTFREAQEVSAALFFQPIELRPGQAFVRSATYYVGPMKFGDLSKLPLDQADVMAFGFFKPISKILLRLLIAFHDYVWPYNYGVAIILLTILIRVVFWPLTHKSTESMKKMGELQPAMKAIREKYKDNPQKQQQEIMALYKQYKINPVSGCLPMLIQIPVFFALFNVLRSAIELRFSPFLWVSDLSQPERLFADVLPIPLNILPIIMAATMAWQQKLTPSAGDPQQRKMMMFMPVVMLVFFYNFASGLSLYWTTNQCLMIAQMLIQRWRKARAQPAEA